MPWALFISQKRSHKVYFRDSLRGAVSRLSFNCDHLAGAALDAALGIPALDLRLVYRAVGGANQVEGRQGFRPAAVRAADDAVDLAKVGRRINDMVHAGMGTARNDDDAPNRGDAQRLLDAFQFARGMKTCVEGSALVDGDHFAGIADTAA